MKLLVSSVDALINLDGGMFFDGVTDALDQFKALSKDNDVLVISGHKLKLKLIPERFNPLYVSLPNRGGKSLINIIKSELKCQTEDIMILAAHDKDMQTAANSKLILLNAQYASENNPDAKLYENDYGIPIKDGNGLKLFLERYQNIATPWYYKLEVDDITTVYGLTNANTFYRPGDVVRLNERFRECLKEGDDTFREPFMVHFLMSTYAIVNELENINYWGTYPSSSGAPNPELEFFVRKARQSFKGRPNPPILVRHRPAVKRHAAWSAAQRLADGCNSQFDTIRLDPYYETRLKGKSVCIVDDFTTYGTSAETTRHLLRSAGVKKIVFIALGKYGREYHQYDYTFRGNIFEDYTYTRKGPKTVYGTYNGVSDMEFISSLKGII